MRLQPWVDSCENCAAQRSKLGFRFQIPTVGNVTATNLPAISERLSLSLHRLTRHALPPMSCLKSERKGNSSGATFILPLKGEFYGALDKFLLQKIAFGERSTDAWETSQEMS